MRERFAKISVDKRGQVTVFLSLIFMILMGLALCVLAGMKLYMETSLSEEAFVEAGNYVLSNYNRSLFERYHVFFLDPQEREHIVADGEAYFNHYLDRSSSFRFQCANLTVTEEKTAVDKDGLYLKHQIREWMKYSKMENTEKKIRELIQAAGEVDQDKALVQKEMKAAKEQHGEMEVETEKEKKETKSTDSVNENRKEGIQWKELKELLGQIGRSGILCYVVDDLSQLSALNISEDNLPSQKEGIRKDKTINFPLSVSEFSGWENLLSSACIGKPDSHFLSDGAFLFGYVFEHFSFYGEKKDDLQRGLQYEIEYLVGGAKGDQENLKIVADQMLMLRFLMNYSFALGDKEMNAMVEPIADVLSGVLGLPVAREAVRILLIAAISYGESLLELHTLFSGGKIVAVKDASTWNLHFYNAAELLKNREKVKTGKSNVSYADYLKVLLAMKTMSKTIYFRMMDLMQVNLRLEQTDFLMEKCIFRFRWKADMKCSAGYSVSLERVTSY